MDWYVVCTRDRASVPVQRFVTLTAAGDHIFYARGFAQWTVKVAQGTKYGPMRELNDREQRDLERRLYPSLFGE